MNKHSLKEKLIAEFINDPEIRKQMEDEGCFACTDADCPLSTVNFSTQNSEDPESNQICIKIEPGVTPLDKFDHSILIIMVNTIDSKIEELLDQINITEELIGLVKTLVNSEYGKNEDAIDILGLVKAMFGYDLADLRAKVKSDREFLDIMQKEKQRVISEIKNCARVETIKKLIAEVTSERGDPTNGIAEYAPVIMSADGGFFVKLKMPPANSTWSNSTFAWGQQFIKKSHGYWSFESDRESDCLYIRVSNHDLDFHIKD